MAYQHDQIVHVLDMQLRVEYDYYAGRPAIMPSVGREYGEPAEDPTVDLGDIYLVHDDGEILFDVSGLFVQDRGEYDRLEDYIEDLVLEGHNA